MIVRPIDKLIKKTAEKLSVDEKMVQLAVKYYYNWVFLRLEDFRRPTISLPSIGSFYPAKANFNYSLQNFLKHLRKDPNREFFKKSFRTLWRMRHRVKDYYKMKKTKSGNKTGSIYVTTK